MSREATITMTTHPLIQASHLNLRRIISKTEKDAGAPCLPVILSQSHGRC